MKNLVMYNFDKQTICFYRVFSYTLYPAKLVSKLSDGLKLKTVERMTISINLN